MTIERLIIKKSIIWIFTSLFVKTILLCLATTIVVGFFIYLSPGRVDMTLARSNSILHKPTRQYDNFPAFYLRWLGHITSGELGRTVLGRKVGEELWNKIKVTGIISFGGAFLSISLAFLFGFYLVARSHYFTMRFALGVLYLLTALPTFFVGYMFISIIPIKLEGIPGYFIAIIILTFGNGIISEFSFNFAHNLKRELKKPYMETAFVKGLRNDTVFPLPGTIFYHAVRQAIILILPRMGLRLSQIVGLSIIIEKLLDLHGLGDMLLDGLSAKDVNCVLVVILCLTLLIRLMAVLNESLLYLLNPRMRI